MNTIIISFITIDTLYGGDPYKSGVNMTNVADISCGHTLLDILANTMLSDLHKILLTLEIHYGDVEQVENKHYAHVQLLDQYKEWTTLRRMKHRVTM